MAFDGIKSIISKPYKFGVLDYPEALEVEKYIKEAIGYSYVGIGYHQANEVVLYMYESYSEYYNINDPSDIGKFLPAVYVPFYILGNKVVFE